MDSRKIIIGITHGDMNGIGYEVILKAMADNRILDICTPIIYGSSKIAGFYKKQLNIQGINLNIIHSANEANNKHVNIINCVDDEVKVEPGISTLEAGKCSFEALERATNDLREGKIDALVTAPINKKNIQSDEFHFQGHTEYLENKFGEKNSSLMMLVNNSLRIAVVTGHIPLKDVSSTLTQDLILKKLKVMNHSLIQDFAIVKPRIAVLSLNPHASDEGLIGNEEEQIIIPTLKKAEEKGILCFGPYPADGFFGSGHFKHFDGILAMYHDQGLIPFKTMSMDNGVNFTAGLPIIRTSPDHGTAYDLAGKNEAYESSLLSAIYLATDIYRNRKFHEEITSNPLQMVETKSDKRKNNIE